MRIDPVMLQYALWEIGGAIAMALLIIYWPETRKRRGPWDRK